MDLTQVQVSFGMFWPEIALGAFFVIALLIDAFTKGSKKPVGAWALVGFLAAGALALGQIPLTRNEFMGEWLFKAGHQPNGFGMLVVDTYAIFFKVLIATAAALVTIFSLLSRELLVDGKPRLGEYFSLMLAMTFGMYLMVGANDMLVMYLGIEIVSLCSYAIVGFTKSVDRASEASMKYVIFGGVASGIMLFGISLIYGMVGSTNFAEIMHYLGAPNAEYVLLNPLLLASIMVLAGLGYKVSAAPFHAWTPDVYEGAPITMTAFLSVASKAAGFALLVRFVVTAYPPVLQGFDWKPILAAVSVLTMSLGNLGALQQTNLKRLLAYSSIAHAGYMMMAVVVGSTYGVSSVLLYFAIYLVMNLGGFFAVQKIAEQIGSEEIEDYKGLGPRMPLLGVMLTVFMISLVGLPPTSGFIAKLYVFSALLEGGREYLWLAVVGVINSVISLYYYVRVLKFMYLEKSTGDNSRVTIDRASMAILGALSLAALLLGLPNFFGPLLNAAQNSLGTLARMLVDTGSRAIGGL